MKPCNFANLYPIWDVLFGTLYVPKGLSAQRFGIRDHMPKNYLARHAYPIGWHHRVMGWQQDRWSRWSPRPGIATVLAVQARLHSAIEG